LDIITKRPLGPFPDELTGHPHLPSSSWVINYHWWEVAGKDEKLLSIEGLKRVLLTFVHGDHSLPSFSLPLPLSSAVSPRCRVLIVYIGDVDSGKKW